MLNRKTTIVSLVCSDVVMMEHNRRMANIEQLKFFGSCCVSFCANELKERTDITTHMIQLEMIQEFILYFSYRSDKVEFLVS